MTDDQPKNPPPPEPMPWDRIGMFLEDMATVGKSMADRNLKLWSTVSQHLRERPYTMDKWADDAALGMQAAMSNVQDTWQFFLRPPERERVADILPTAFVFIAARYEGGKTRYVADAPVWMRVPLADVDRLPDSAEIDVTGIDPQGVKALKESLGTKLGPSRQAYLLEVTNPNKLLPGVYGGSVYLKTPNVRPIANLRVIVEDAPGR